MKNSTLWIVTVIWVSVSVSILFATYVTNQIYPMFFFLIPFVSTVAIFGSIDKKEAKDTVKEKTGKPLWEVSFEDKRTVVDNDRNRARKNKHEHRLNKDGEDDGKI